MTIDFNQNILAHLLNENPKRATTAFKEFPKLLQWQEKKEKPTFDELSKMAHFFNIPFGYFFLNEIPQKIYPIPHYRTTIDRNFEPSAELQQTLQTIENRQEFARDILMSQGVKPLPFANSIKIGTDVEIVANNLRSLLNLDVHWNRGLKTLNDAFFLLINRIEEIGIYVVVNSVVGYNNNLKLSLEEFRGFVLYDSYAPFIFINNQDFISGKIFTIIHEVAHVLIGESASFALPNLLPSNDTTEQYCNSIAAEFLVPKVELLKQFVRVGNNYNILGSNFKVSRIVIARRLYDLKKISKNEYNEAYKIFGKAEKKDKSKNKKDGGQFYNTAPYKVSRSFFDLIYSAVKQNKLLYRDAFNVTNLSPKSFDGYVAKYYGVS